MASDTVELAAVEAELRQTAATMRRVRIGAAVFLIVQFGLYSPSGGGDLPWPRWPVAGAFLVALALTNLFSLRAGKAGGVARLLRSRNVEIAVDTALVVILALLFSFDEDTRIWPLLTFPILEGAFRASLPGALWVWGGSATIFSIDQVLRMPSRQEPEAWVAAIPWAAGILLLNAWVSGQLAKRLNDSRAQSQEQAVDLRRLANELRWTMNSAEHADKAKTELLSRVSHELRTPLNAMLGFSQLLALGDLDEEQRDSVDHVLKAGRHLLVLVDEVLQISRIEQGRMTVSLEPVELSTMIAEVRDLSQPSARARDVQLIIDPSISDATVLADHQRLRQVLLHVVGNAINYNRPSGTVTFTCANVGDTAQIRVTDTGPGLDETHLERIFEPFDRLGLEDSDVTGAGLGLALSRRLLAAMNGSIGVDSRLGEGSTFWVELPSTDTYIQRQEAVSEKLADPVGQERFSGRVLYVEDNLSNLRLMERLLDRFDNVELLSAMQGGLGLQLARDHHLDLIMLDLNLPDMGGDEVLQRLKDDPATANTPVVIISADATERQIARLLVAGAHRYLTKPFDVTQLLHTLEEVLPMSASGKDPTTSAKEAL